MATTLPLNTKQPVKHFQAQIRYKMNDGTFVEVQPDATKRSIIINALNVLAGLNPNNFPTGLEVTNIEIDLGNQLDVVKPA
jgi:hypothetical protein